MSKILVLVSALLLITACGTTGANLKGSKSTDSVAKSYSAESKDLEPFTPIPGSDTGAKASDRVFFAFDSAVINANGQETLNRQAKWLKKNAGVKVTVEGHCDERGTREYNLALGERRAAAVKRYLVSSGIAANRVATVSYGKERPAVLGSSSAAHAENRRGVTVLNR